MPTKKSPAQTRKTGTKKGSDATKVGSSSGSTATTKIVTSRQFPIVGVGASAGGLEALESLFSAMPVDSGAAFVVVAHLDPNHASLLPELIQKKTPIPVGQVTDNQRVEPNRIYIIPPNRELAILNGHLQLLESVRDHGLHLPIDSFFRSLAKDQGAHAVCIVLSGTGSDGSLGLRAIKGEGGTVMVQDPESAKYDGMPRNAIETGLADFILSPEQMPQQLLSFMRGLTNRTVGTVETVADSMVNALQKIYVLLRASTQHDFSQYKQNTICRRIERRMYVHQIENVDDYVRCLRESQREVTILFKDLLINVTSFFRDPAAFELLRDKYLPELLKSKPDNYALRAWVPGCSSGEEAYSLAIILQEAMETLGRHFQVQIFATDIDEDAVNTARAALYPESIVADVGAARLKRFFTKEDNRFRIRKSIRDMVVFATQNVIKDPPFSKLDLVSCRNLLIYFGPSLQKKILPLFHYSLKAEGLLLLGTSESIGPSTDLFGLLDKKWKIFRRKTMSAGKQSNLELACVAVTPEKKAFPAAEAGQTVDTLQLLKSMLAQSHLPPCVVINDRSDIIYVHGRIGPYLEPPQGEASFNVLAMARPELKAALHSAIRKVATERLETSVSNLQLKNNGNRTCLNLTVRPLAKLQHDSPGFMLVLFEETTPAGGKMTEKSSVKTRKKETSEDVSKLEEELLYTRESLQASIEELEAANEELKSTNEELQSTNEELQSTNEELETSKEELQSLNEESSTVNAELQGRIDELSTANDDMKNLLDSTNIATIFLDIDLGIRRYTPKVTELIPLTPSDIGRPLHHFSSEFQDLNLTHQAQTVINTLEVSDLEAQSSAGRCYRVRTRPYRTLKNLIDGVVITFEDITELKKLDKERQLAALLQNSNDAILLQDFSGNILSWNHGAERMYGYTEAEALQLKVATLIPEDQAVRLEKVMGRVQNREVEPLVTERLHKNGSKVRVLLTMTRLVESQKNTDLLLTTEMNLTKLSEGALRQLTGLDDG